jgi:magnesium chelatase family protein
VPSRALERFEFAGELSLSGELRPILGTLAMTFAVSKSAANRYPRGFILPLDNADEASLVSDIPIFPARTLLDVVAHLNNEGGDQQARRIEPHFATVRLTPPSYPDFFDVKGQVAAKRALEIAAAGGHSVLMVGPPGTGKSMLAQRFAGLLPPMSPEEALESAAVLSLVGQFAPQRWATRMFRAPHHTASAIALVGGGSNPMPGEISLAHCGVLFLDELPEFDRRVLEVMREPLETGRITIARASRHVDYPAHFQLLAAMNPCPCGYFGHKTIACRCTPEMVARYQDRISGPLLDRIDMRVEVPSLSEDELVSLPDGTPTRYLAERVARAYEIALNRQGKRNDELQAAEIERMTHATGSVKQLLHAASTRLGWSARAYHRVLKVARTIADLAAVEELSTEHVGEAIQYRRSLRET